MKVLKKEFAKISITIIEKIAVKSCNSASMLGFCQAKEPKSLEKFAIKSKKIKEV